MRINNVVRFSSGASVVSNNLTGRNITFERKLRENEKTRIAKDIDKGFDILGKQVRAMIIHGPNFPESKTGVNTGMGSPYGQEDFNNFVKTFGFNYLQLGPIGARNHGQRSHYLSSIYEKDPTLINLELLSGDDYAGILPKESLKHIIRTAQKKAPDNKSIKTGSNYARSNFEKAELVADESLRLAYSVFIGKVIDKDKDAIKLNREFKAFKNSPDNSWLNDYAVLHLIAENNYNGNDWYLNWSKQDQDFIPMVHKGNREAVVRYDNILEENSSEIEFYKFKQFIAHKQAVTDKENSSIFKISDRIASQSSFDILTNRDIFLDEWCIGAKGGGYKGTPQFWGFPFIDPMTLFNSDGTLGRGGEYIKKKFQSALDGVDMIRVDHVFAYANPYVYRRSFAQNPANFHKDWVNGKEISYVDTHKLRGNAGFLMDKYFDWDKDGQYVSHLNIPGKENYKRIIPEIIFPALVEMGFDEEELKKVAWETLGDWNPVFSHDVRPSLNLSGMHSLRYMPGDHKELHYGDYALIGTHDDPPAQFLIRNPGPDNHGVWKKEYLAHFLRHSHTAPKDWHGNVIANQLSEQELVKAKFVDLFTSKTDKFALNFIDFFGIEEQANVPGTNDAERPENWTLRLPDSYDDNYYKALIDFKREFAINIPEILRMSLENMLDSGEIPVGKIHEARKTIENLARWEEILKEPEK